MVTMSARAAIPLPGPSRVPAERAAPEPRPEPRPEPSPGPGSGAGRDDDGGRTARPAAPAHETTSILVRFERAELAGAACALGDLVRELRGAGAPPSGSEIVSLLDAYHRHLCSAYRGCAPDGTAPVLAFSSFARAPRRDLSTDP